MILNSDYFMKKILTLLLFTFTSALFFCGCNKYVVYDKPFVAFVTSDATSIDCTAVRDAEYRVHYSGTKVTSNIEVTFSVILGDGLKEGVDFDMITSGNKLVFLPGIYELPIRIAWKSNPIDKSKDNTMTIRLESANEGVTLGMPGPAQNMREVKIMKY